MFANALTGIQTTADTWVIFDRCNGDTRSNRIRKILLARSAPSRSCLLSANGAIYRTTGA